MLNTKNKIKLLSASIFSKSISKEMNEVGYKYIPNLIDNSKLNIILDELLNVDENKFKRYDNDIRLFSVYKNINGRNCSIFVEKYCVIIRSNLCELIDITL